MPLGIRNCRKQCLIAGFLILSSTLASHAALADISNRSTGVVGQSIPTNQEAKAESDQRFLTLFRAAPLSLTQAIAVAEALHAGSRAVAVAFDASGIPGYRVRTVKNSDIWENVVDVTTGRTIGLETSLSMSDLEVDERDNIMQLKSVGQELSDAVAIAEKAAAGKAIGGGLVKGQDQVNFLVVVLSDDHVKEVYLDPPHGASKNEQTISRKNDGH